MGKIRSINGLPNDLVQKYMSTIMYYDKGYMADWIWKRMNELKILNAEIDLFSENTYPEQLKVKPIIAYLPELRLTIQKTLLSNNFEIDFIKKGVFKVSIDKIDIAHRRISIQCILETNSNKILTGKVYNETTYPIADSLFEKIMKKIL